MVNSERNLTLHQPATAPPGDTLPDGGAHRAGRHEMGYGDAFAYSCAEEVFEELRGSGTRRPGGICAAHRMTGCAARRCSGPAPDDSADRHPLRYLNDGHQSDQADPRRRIRTCLAFPTPSGRGVPRPAPPAAREMPDGEFPMLLNTGRLAHQWHTMTKTGRVDKLNKLNPEPFVEIHPEDAVAPGITEGDSVRISPRAAGERHCRPC